MDSRLYVARLEVEGDLRNLVITINDKDNDCNLGWDTDGDADIWLQIGKLWIAAPGLLAACEAARDWFHDLSIVDDETGALTIALAEAIAKAKGE